MAEGAWHQNVEAFPASVRALWRRHLLLTLVAVVVILLALVTQYWSLAIVILLILAALATWGVRIAHRSSLCTSDAGIVLTNGRYLISIPWRDLCCFTDSRSPFDRRVVAHYRQQPVRSADEQRPLQLAQRMALIHVHGDRATSLSFYRVEPRTHTRFGEVLQRHRPDLVAVGALPLIRAGTLCEHALGPGVFERLLPRTVLIKQHAVLILALVIGFTVGTAISNEYVQIACAIPLAFFVLAIFVQPGFFRLTVAPVAGLTESSSSGAQIHVPWNDITSITRSRTGLFQSWFAHFPARDPTPIITNGTESSIEELGRDLVDRGGRTRINLTDYSLDPRHLPLRQVLDQVRPDLIGEPPSREGD